MLGLQNEREWGAFCEHVLLRPALAVDPLYASNAQRNENRAKLQTLILEEFSKLTVAGVVERLERAKIANAQVNTMADLWSHPQLKARDRLGQVDTPVGPITALLPPGRNNSFQYRMGPIPAVGEHTQAILRQLGRGEEDIAALHEQRAI
jgi:crotonobetainyl-CoA:carnitine CoA-transferase CaiB-like acyl-CoA transferase